MCIIFMCIFISAKKKRRRFYDRFGNWILVIFPQFQIKCVRYWPDVGSILFYGDKTVANVNETSTRDYFIRELHVNRQVKVNHNFRQFFLIVILQWNWNMAVRLQGHVVFFQLHPNFLIFINCILLKFPTTHCGCMLMLPLSTNHW